MPLRNMYRRILLPLLMLYALTASAQDINYGFGKWNSDSLGNHRAVLSVNKASDAVLATIEWRRRDSNPEDKNIIIVDASTGKELTNVRPISIDREKGVIAFQPQTVPGEYYVYYLQNVMSGSPYYPTVTYPPFNDRSDPEWVKRNRLDRTKIPALPEAGPVQLQAINELNSFYPMELIATKAETDRLLKEHPGEGYILFTEDRRFPVRMTGDIPYKWIQDDRHDFFEGQADKGEYYTFQIGVWAAREDVRSLSLNFSDLMCQATGERIPASSCTCFNTGGTDVTGEVFVKDCSVALSKVQPLWIGIDIPEQQKAGTYCGTVTVNSENAGSRTVRLTLTVSDKVIANHGDNEPWRHSRLRWLNSSKGFDDEVIAPYTPLTVDGMTISCLGRKFKISATGLPENITSYFKETMTGISDQARDILSGPVSLYADGGEWENMDFSFTGRRPGAVSWKALNRNGRFLMALEATMEADGNVEYRLRLTATEDADIDDIALKATLAEGIGKYMLGLGEKGGFCPSGLKWTWDVEKNQDAVWLGDVNAGIQFRFYDDRYERPLNTNFYHQKPLIMPASWCNQGKGGIDISKSDSGITDLKAYSGSRKVIKGETLCYYFTIAVTPFRPIDTDKQWRERYWHKYDFLDNVQKNGGSVINVHHATAINPFINYPFLRPQEMKAYIDGAHARGMKVKIYNTVRELSNSCVEIFALRSLGDEIFSQGEGGGYSWLQEHLDQDYIGAWFARSYKDAAIVNSGVSRWHNYYIEGLDWLVKNVGIDGLYIDDLAFDRSLMKRVRKVLNGTNPGAMIDLHSANQYNIRDGFANSANLYMEHLPYIDRLWFGEYFDYSSAPEYWMTEVSGIPFGLMSEMLQGGGNPWRGMLYGMTGRSPSVDNSAMWSLWDDFGMEGSEMVGYWVSDNPVKTGSDKTLATVYCHKGAKALISLATWEEGDAKVNLSIDWDALGLDPSKASLHAPAVKGFQDEHSWKPGESITVPEGKGLLIVIR